MLRFLGIGAQKAGTTWLYKMLTQHPDISFPLNKEAHYWNNQFPVQTPEDYLNNFTCQNKFEGEITPAYAILPEETIQEIYKNLPDLRIIYILRNPIDRAWSSAKMALGRAEMEFEEASNQWFIDHFHSKQSLLRGDYQSCLRSWRKFYPEESILIIPFEEIKDTPALTLQRCCKHIGVSNYPQHILQSMNIHSPVFPTRQSAMNEYLSEELIKIYYRKIKELELYLNLDLAKWINHKL